MKNLNLLASLIVLVVDSLIHGDLSGHLTAWRCIAKGFITPDTRFYPTED